MAINLLGYTGDAELGVGSSPDAVMYNPANNLNVINQAARDVMLLDNERNMRLFRQRVQDRDNLERLILEEKVATGDILPEYRTQFDAAKKKTEDIFFNEFRGNFNNLPGYKKWVEANQELRDVAAHAQVKTRMFRELEKQKAGETLPRKQKEMEDFIKRQKARPFWDQVDPYQQLHDFNMGTIDELPRLVTRKLKNATTGVPFDVDETVFDYDDIRNRAASSWLTDRDKAHDISMLADKFQKYDPIELGKTVDALNARLIEYNTERGLVEGEKSYAAPIRTKAIGGDLVIDEPAVEFAAKYALAKQPQFVVRSQKFNKELADYGLKKDRLALDAKKLGIEASKAGAYIRHLGALDKKINDSLLAQGTDISKQYDDFINNVRPQSLSITAGGKETERLDAVFMDRLPKGYQLINGPVVDKKTGKVTVGALEPYVSNKEKRPYYISKYVDATTGEEIRSNKFPSAMEEGYQQTRLRRDISRDDFIKGLLKTGALELILQGKNGAANFTSMYQSAKTLNAAVTTKGEENIINPPPPIEQEQDEEE